MEMREGGGRRGKEGTVRGARGLLAIATRCLNSVKMYKTSSVIATETAL
jgi:hypothetical protein